MAVLPSTKNLDLNAVALARAIRHNESGGNYNAPGKSGERGAYQFLPAVWKEWAGKYIKDPNAPQTPENQNAVAYLRIKERKDAGLTPAQILSEWNSGSVNFQGKKGVNSKGVEYDVPVYVQRGIERFQKEVATLGGSVASGSSLPATPPSDLPPPPAEEQPGFLTSVARGLINPALRSGYTALQGVRGVFNAGQAIYDKVTGDEAGYQRNIAEGINATNPNAPGFKLPVLGQITPVNGLKDSIATGAELGATLLGEGVAKEGGKALVKGLVKQTFVQAGKVGALQGGAQAFGEALQNPRATAAKVAGATAAGTGLGFVTAGVLAAGGAAASAGLRKFFGRIHSSSAIADVADSAAADLPAKGWIGRTINRIDDTMKRRADLKAQPAVVQQAVQSGVPEPVAAFIHNASPADKTAFRTMTDFAENGSNTLRPTNQPKEVVGKTIIQRLKDLDSLRTKAGVQLNKIKAALPSTRPDLSNTFNIFTEKLQSFGIRVRKNGTLDFSESSIGTVTGSQDRRLVNEVWSHIRNGNTNSRATLDRLRQRLFQDLKLGKANNVVTEPVDSFLSGIRSSLRQDIAKGAGVAGKKYLELTEKYAAASEPIAEFYSLLGKKWMDRSEQLTSLRAGEIASRVLSNASADAMSVLMKIEDSARQLGFKYADDPIQQVIFSDVIEDLVGTTQTRTFRNQAARGMRDAGVALADAGADVLGGSKLAAGRKLLNWATSKTPEEQLRALRMLLR